MELVLDTAAVVADRHDAHRVVQVPANVSWRARPGSPRVEEEKTVAAAEAPARANATDGLSAQAHIVEVAVVRTTSAGLQLSPDLPMGHQV